jgi:hypothetical protein
MINTNNKFLSLLVVVLLVLLVAKYLVAKDKDSTPSNPEYIGGLVESMPEAGAISKSNMEWFLVSVASLPQELVKESLITTTVSGTVEKVDTSSGKANILSKYYYVGEPGVYEYGGALTLQTENGQSTPLLFSHQRMEKLEVIRVVNGVETVIGFEDLEEGDVVEVSETNDLAINNIDDANVLSVVIRVLE